MPSPQLSKLRAAAVDGRLVNPIYRQVQLKNLHDALLASSASIESALAQDSPSHRPIDVKLQLRLALRLLAQTATSVAPEQALKDEYAIANKQDMPNGRQPFGIVVIEQPTVHAWFYGLISALAPAIAEGNVVVVQTQGNSLLQTPKLVFDLIAKTLDHDIFAVVTDSLSPEDIGHRHLRVIQNSTTNEISSTDKLVSHPQTRTVAIVERDADIPSAADALVVARFSLGGKSPYAPDLVLVNEWVKRDLIIALSASSARFLADSSSGTSSSSKPSSTSQKSNGASIANKAVESGSATIISSSPSAAIVDVHSRDSPLLAQKINEACLLLHSIKSMDDAIDTAARNGGSLAAAYVFTKPDAAKYIGQFTDSSLVFVNHIPLEILFGPISPSGHPTTLTTSTPYSRTQFSLPKQQFINPSQLSTTLTKITTNPASASALLASLDPASLPEVKRLKNRLALGFFEQGIVTGGVILLSVVLSSVVGAGYLAFRGARGRLF